jgi:hypothetical protein
VNGIHPVFLGDADNLSYVEVSANGFALATNLVGFVRLETMQGEAIFVGIDSHGPKAEFGGCPKHPDRNFTSVRNQKFPDGSRHCLTLVSAINFASFQSKRNAGFSQV